MGLQLYELTCRCFSGFTSSISLLTVFSRAVFLFFPTKDNIEFTALKGVPISQHGHLPSRGGHTRGNLSGAIHIDLTVHCWMNSACLNAKTAPCKASFPGGVTLTLVATVSLNRFINECAKIRHSYGEKMYKCFILKLSFPKKKIFGWKEYIFRSIPVIFQRSLTLIKTHKPSCFTAARS